MGTSTSHRSPQTPRYSAFVAAMRGGPGPERAVSELYGAASATWVPELSGPAVLPFVVAAIDAYDTLAGRLATGESAVDVISGLVRSARISAIHESGGSPAVALGERALTRVIVGLVSGEHGLAATSPSEAATRWAVSRGDSGETVARQLIGEVARQLALHITSRDVPQIVRSGERSASDANALVRDIAEHAAAVAYSAVGDARLQRESLARDWSTAVATAFKTGRRLPGEPDA